MVDRLKPGGTPVGPFIRNLLQTLSYSAEDLAELIAVHPVTVKRWLEGGKIDLGCARVLLEMLWNHPREASWLLAQQKETREGPKDWPARIVAVQEKLGITREDFLTLLNTSRWTLNDYESGKKEPAGCYAVLLDILHDHTEEAVELIGWEPPAETPRTPWNKKNLQTLLGRLGLTMTDLASLLGVNPAAVREWAYGWSSPGACTGLLLDLLDTDPANAVPALEEVRDAGPSAWTAEDVRKVREDFGMSRGAMAMLLDTAYSTIQEWESAGLPGKSGCPGVLYSLLARRGRWVAQVLTDIRS